MELGSHGRPETSQQLRAITRGRRDHATAGNGCEQRNRGHETESYGESQDSMGSRVMTRPQWQMQ